MTSIHFSKLPDITSDTNSLVVTFLLLLMQVKELPTFKDVDFRNNMQKVYVTEEQKEKIMEKLNRDVEVKTCTVDIWTFKNVYFTLVTYCRMNCKR